MRQAMRGISAMVVLLQMKIQVHTYAEAGDYDVTLTAKDDNGLTSSVTQTVSVSAATYSSEIWASAEGKVWTLAPVAGAFRVGPAIGSGEWFASSADDATARACQYDDEFIFATDGSFTFDSKGAMYGEGFMGVDPAGCVNDGDIGGVYAGFVTSTGYTFATTDATDTDRASVTVTGTGAFLGFNKGYNGGEYNGSDAALQGATTYKIFSYFNDGTVERVDVAVDIFRRAERDSLVDNDFGSAVILLHSYLQNRVFLKHPIFLPFSLENRINALFKKSFLPSLLILSLLSCDSNEGEPSPQLPGISINDLEISERKEDFSITLDVTLSEVSADLIVVSYETVEGSAVADQDFKHITGQLIFQAGSVRESITLTIFSDEKMEDDESFSIRLFDPANAVMNDSSALIVIKNFDTTPPPNELVIPTQGYTSPESYDGWNLVWQDEFDQESLNTEDWTYEIGNGHSGWGNNELEYYTNENTSMVDGNLVITARKESRGGYHLYIIENHHQEQTGI